MLLHAGAATVFAFEIFIRILFYHDLQFWQHKIFVGGLTKKSLAICTSNNNVYEAFCDPAARLRTPQVKIVLSTQAFRRMTKWRHSRSSALAPSTSTSTTNAPSCTYQCCHMFKVENRKDFCQAFLACSYTKVPENSESGLSELGSIIYKRPL